MACPLSEEQVNRIVEWVHAGKSGQPSTPEQAALFEWALEMGFDGDWDGGGVVVPEDLIPALDSDYAYFLRQNLPESRLTMLEEGEAPTDEEVKLFREVWLDAMLLEGEADADYIPGYIWHVLRHTDGRTCIAAILAKGYSFSGVEYKWFGFFMQVDDVYRALRSLGNLDVDRAEQRRRKGSQ